MIRVQLSEEQRAELQSCRRHSDARLAERALMILLNDEGFSAQAIAHQLKRFPHTIRKWLKRYIALGIQGLNRKYSPGRPDHIRQQIKAFIPEIIEQSPERFGYPVSLWTSNLIADAFMRKTGLRVSCDTVRRAMHDDAYSYRRSRKSTPLKAPTRDAKAARIAEILEEIKDIQVSGTSSDHEILAVDESHFSTEPYVVSGWQKKG
jgi:transposase